MSPSDSSLPHGFEGSMAQRMQEAVEEAQAAICEGLEVFEPDARFLPDRWSRDGGGGGLTRVLQEGRVFEKGGVNTSAVWGSLPERMAQVLEVEALPFFATGVSLVVHPQSPYVPTVHANFRYFALGEDLRDPADEWFGGGADLTPVYPFLADAQHFHQHWKDVCDTHADVADYRAFKQQCDEYFYLPHRSETRGVGGIFYDYLRDAPEALLTFSTDAMATFLPSYVPIVKRRKDRAFGERQRQFQQVRRGRYVEFNLVYDRGTKFGLETEGRTESILMSLPLQARWPYNFTPEPGSPEGAVTFFLRPRELARRLRPRIYRKRLQQTLGRRTNDLHQKGVGP